MISIIIVDDHQIFRESLAELLVKQGFNVLALARNGKEFLDLLHQYTPEIVVMDISMPEMDGYEATKQALAKFPDLKIIILSSHSDQKYYYQMVQAGAKGFIVKNAGINELKLAIQEVAGGGSWFSSELLQSIIYSMNKDKVEDKIKLTERELEVLQYICKGYTAERIAEELHLSQETIRTYRANLLAKTECPNAPALVMYAIKHKLIEI